ncbi:PREDICTED: DNA-directed RNA polymerase III subunit RPC7-like [Cyprinodon variegatus]|uniref:DNA-directed RNA polymerase III subunit RPC7-like n=1 Tax=Cyprinodon variegatus TaxID=28743 RepID=UPI0007429FD9|nr:PREDICTED: DNA-directed RNA polymerase III subunit RPC7-like [Cyprinodon variegatus]
MAGRGRGRRTFGFMADSVGVSRGDALSAAVQQPTPVFPETDYIMSYFDNGEDFGGDSDDNMDEAIY